MLTKFLLVLAATAASMTALGQNINNALINELSAFPKSGPEEIRRLGGYDCFQMPPQKNFDFFVTNKCFSTDKTPGRKVVMLIGDSHSASLSLGLRSWVQGKGFDYYQISSGVCSLFSDDMSDKACQEYTNKTFEAVQKVKPDVLIVDSYWSHLEGAFFKNTKKWPSFHDYLNERFDLVSKLGATKVLLVGEVPTWIASLPEILIKDYVIKGQAIPDRTIERLNGNSINMDNRMRALKLPPSFTYVSLKDIFCTSQGCMTRLREYPTMSKDIVVWDYGHLTEASAKTVVTKALGPSILEALADRSARPKK